MSEANPRVLLKTSQGDITLELQPEQAPLTVENFLQYVRDGFFDGTIFHRVIPGFMIQGGGFTTDMTQKETRSPVKNEADNGLQNRRGAIAMARTQIVDSATAQFFINLVDNDFLNFRDSSPQGYGYSVFGLVADGMDTVDSIAQVATGSHGFHQDVPQEAVIIESAVVID